MSLSITLCTYTVMQNVSAHISLSQGVFWAQLFLLEEGKWDFLQSRLKEIFYIKCDWKHAKVAIIHHQLQFTSAINSNSELWVHNNHTSGILFKSLLSHQAFGAECENTLILHSWGMASRSQDRILERKRCWLTKCIGESMASWGGHCYPREKKGVWLHLPQNSL